MKIKGSIKLWFGLQLWAFCALFDADGTMLDIFEMVFESIKENEEDE